MNWNLIILLVGSAIIAMALALILALGANKFRSFMLGRKAKKFAAGSMNNIFNLDGEKINVNKFRTRGQDGKTVVWEIAPPRVIQPIIPENIGQEGETKRQFKRLSDYQ